MHFCNSVNIRRAHSWFLATLVLGAAGCRPANPLDDQISANTNVGYLLWRGDEMHRLSPEQWKMFDAALQDLRFQLADHYGVHGAAALDSTLLTVLDGASVRDVLTKGIGLRITRLRLERDQLAYTLRSNAQLLTYRDDTLSANRLEALQHEDLVRRQQDVDEIAAEHAFLIAIGAVDKVQDPVGKLVLPKHQWVERPDDLPKDPGPPQVPVAAAKSVAPQLAPLPPMTVQRSVDVDSAPKVVPAQASDP